MTNLNFQTIDKFKPFLVRYRYDGAEWSFSLKARDLDDAKARIKSLHFAKIDGELVMEIPGYTGPLASIIITIRNALCGRRGKQT